MTILGNFRHFIYIFLFTDEAPDTGDDSDEDLVTNYLAKGTGTVGATSDTLVPTIHITPQSPNGNHVLGKKKVFLGFGFIEILIHKFLHNASFGKK